MNSIKYILFNFTLPFVLILTLFVMSAAMAFAASDNASTNEGFTQGLQKSGATVDIARSNPAQALGAPDSQFVSLGYGGSLILGFAQNMSGNLLLTVQEVTSGSYPLETADVYVGTNPAGPWTYVGEATNDGGAGDESTSFTVSECYQYVRLVDTTDGALHTNTSDGFDVDALTANYDENCPVPESETSSHLNISLHNSAMVMNEVETIANTGGNTAAGSYAGGGGNGGSIESAHGEQDVEDSTTGNGGTGGNAGLGGAVQTGNALAEATISNTANSSIIRMSDCGCENAIGRLRIRTKDNAFVANRVLSGANTGDNTADGSYAGTGGNGGAITSGGHSMMPSTLSNDNNQNSHTGEQEVDGVTTGTGGTGGNGTDGGTVLTGQSTARSIITNLINSTRIRVR